MESMGRLYMNPYMKTIKINHSPWKSKTIKIIYSPQFGMIKIPY